MDGASKEALRSGTSWAEGGERARPSERKLEGTPEPEPSAPRAGPGGDWPGVRWGQRGDGAVFCSRRRETASESRGLSQGQGCSSLGAPRDQPKVLSARAPRWAQDTFPASPVALTERRREPHPSVSQASKVTPMRGDPTETGCTVPMTSNPPPQ